MNADTPADARWLIAVGLLILAAGNFWMSQLNLDISPWQAVWPRVVMIAGLGMIFAPLNVAAYLYIPLTLRGAAVGLFALLRNEGGSFGTSMGQTIVERREIFHALRLNENLDRLNPAVHSYLGRVQQGFLQQTGDLAAAHRMALQSLEDLREQQASALASGNVRVSSRSSSAVVNVHGQRARRSWQWPFAGLPASVAAKELGLVDGVQWRWLRHQFL